MNVTIYFRFIAAIILFGISFYFLNDFLGLTREYLPTSGSYFSALLFMWGILPAIVLFTSGVRLVIAAQKR
jgi:hypothetical protein